MAYGYYYSNRNRQQRPDRELVSFLLALLGMLFVCYMLASCTTSKEFVSDVRTDSVVVTSTAKTDSVAVRTVVTDRLIDHYLTNTYVVSPLGDTIGTKTYEKLVIKTDTKQTDSIRVLQSRCDSLLTKLRENTVKDTTKTVTTPFSFFDKLRIAMFPALLFIIVVLIVYIVLNNKIKQ